MGLVKSWPLIQTMIPKFQSYNVYPNNPSLDEIAKFPHPLMDFRDFRKYWKFNGKFLKIGTSKVTRKSSILQEFV
jgi:hypothetical protein